MIDQHAVQHLAQLNQVIQMRSLVSQVDPSRYLQSLEEFPHLVNR